MSIILNKGLSTEYTFPRNFSIDPPPWAKRLNEMERAYKHGAVITGDEMVKARPQGFGVRLPTQQDRHFEMP